MNDSNAIGIKRLTILETTSFSNMASRDFDKEDDRKDDGIFLGQFLRREFVRAPKEYHRGQNIEEYITSVSDYCDAMRARECDRIYIIINNLDDEVKYELFALPEYNAHSKDMKWIIRTLIQLNKTRSTVVTPLLELMKIRQTESQTVMDFATRLRVKAFQLMGHDDPLKREKFLIKAFLKGLCNRRLAASIPLMEPETLTEAIEIAKREKGNSREDEGVHKTDGMCAIVNNEFADEQRMSGMEHEISMLREKIDYLISIVKAGNQNFECEKRAKGAGQQRMQQRTFQSRKFETKCFNCNMLGHLAKDCKAPCKICHKTNHTSYNCFKRNMNARGVRAFQDISETDRGDVYESETSMSVERNIDYQDEVFCVQENDRSRQETPLLGPNYDASSVNVTVSEANFRENDDFEQAKSNHVDTSHKKTYKDALLTRNKRSGSQDKRIEKWVQYVNGNGNKPKRHYSTQTVITNRRPELAANKPIVKAKVENTPVKLFCDSGAECNTINLELFKKIKESQPSLMVYRDDSRIKCASGALIKCVGIVNLTLTLGEHQSIHPFKIIPNMFPEIIAGIKLMKRMGLRVNPAKDCVEIGGTKIPFISKVREETFHNQGNDVVPF